MSNLGDIFGSNKEAIDRIGGMFGLLADISGAIGFVQEVQSLIAPDLSLQDVLNDIQTEFSQLEGEIAATNKLAKMRDVDENMRDAVGVFYQLPDILNGPPITLQEKHDDIQICEAAVHYFSNVADWQALRAELPYYSDGWSGTLAPQADSSGEVFNYTYTLPQFLRAIYILLTVIRALEPKSLPDYATTFASCVDLLTSLHQTITSGIVGTRMPSVSDVGFYSPPSVGYDVGPQGSQPPGYFSTNWTTNPGGGDAVLNPYGAVEIYSGSNNVGSYAADFFPYGVDLTSWGTTSANNFMALIALRITKQMKSLYVQIGMPTVLTLLNQLRQLIGQPPSTDAPYSAWPFNEVISMLGLTLPPHHGVGIQSPWSEPFGVESALKDFLSYTPPYAGFDSMGQPIDPVPLPSGSLYTFLTGESLQPVARQGVGTH
jgi:hypothetical protein